MLRFLFLLVFLVSCGTQPSVSTTQGLGASGSGNNVAVLIGAPNGLAGVATDIRELTTLFSTPDFRFQVFSNGNARVSDILSLVKEKSATADSFMFYFSGHGSRGSMQARDRGFGFREVATAIKEARGNKPLERLLVIIDACYSGSFVDDSAAIITEPDAETGSHVALTEKVYNNMDNQLYKQAFVFSASKKSETSLDLGSAKGGSFTYTFRTIMKDMFENNYMVNFREFAQAVSRKTEQEYDHTPMWRGFPSSEVMDDYVFLYRMN